jgi:DNA-binding response OmpR family regulator
MKTRVLLAEDDAQLRSFMAEALDFLGFDVTVAPDGAQALKQAEEADFDVVVTDHRMPVLGGIDLVRGLRAGGFRGRICVASGVLSAAERAAYEAMAVDGIAMKPLALAELNGLLRGWIETPAAPRTRLV